MVLSGRGCDTWILSRIITLKILTFLICLTNSNPTHRLKKIKNIMLHDAVHRLYLGVLYSQNAISLDKGKRQIPSKTQRFLVFDWGFVV
jgi:hypothetical protein